MADIKIRIEVNPNAENEMIGDIKNVNAEISNVSLKTDSLNVFQNIPTSENQGINGISFAKDLVFDSEGYLDNDDLKGGVIESERDTNEFVWGVVPDNKEYSVKIIFTNAKNLKDIIIYGDSVVGQFPTRAIIDGDTEIYTDDCRWIISLKNESDTHSIEFTHWNRANYNACLTFISIMMKYIEIDKKNGLKTVESLSQSTGQPKEIYYGVVANNGEFKIVDVDGEILEMIKNSVIDTKPLRTDIYVNNKCIQTHISSDNNYDNVSKILDVDLVNDLVMWQQITFDGYNYPEKEESAYDVLVNLFSYIGKNKDEVDDMISGNIFDNNDNYVQMKDYLSNIVLEFPSLPTSSFRSAIDKFCVLAQLNLYIDDDNKIKFVSARPLIHSTQSIINVPLKNQFSVLNKSVILKNKYDSVEVPKYNILDTIDYEKIVASGEYTERNSTVTIGSNSKTSPVIPANGTISISEARLKMDVTFYSGKLNIYKKQEHNLKNIAKIYNGLNEDGDPYIRHTVYYTHRTGNIDKNGNITWQTEEESSGEITKHGYTLAFAAKWGSSGSYPSVSVSDISNLKNLTPTLKVDENNEEYYEVDFTVAVGWYAQAREYSTIGSSAYDGAGIVEEYVPKKLEISAYGDVREIDFEMQSTDTYHSVSTNPIKIGSSELITNQTKIDGIEISNIIKNNILNDYKNGISDAKITVACTDYFDVNGNKIVDWTNGEILKTADIIKIENDDRIWKITGRKFRHYGVPLVDLELQEVRVKY